MKKLLVLFILFLCAAPVFAQNEAAKDDAAEDSSIGLDFSVTYYTKYLWRGIDFYDGDGYLYPAISWEIFGSGFKLTAAAELSEGWLIDGWGKKPKRYYMSDPTDIFSIYRKQLPINHVAYASHGLDFCAEYSHTFEDVITLGANVWYYWYFNSKYAREWALTKVESSNIRKRQDISYVSAGVTVGLDFVPWVNPVITGYYDHYIFMKRGGDYYVNLALSHDFEIYKDVVTITPGVSAGYYYGRTYRTKNYYIASLNGLDFDITPIWAGGDDFPWVARTPLPKGFSDVTPSVTLSVQKGGFYCNAGFYWVIVPAKSWYKGGDVHRYYASLGAGYAL